MPTGGSSPRPKAVVLFTGGQASKAGAVVYFVSQTAGFPFRQAGKTGYAVGTFALQAGASRATPKETAAFSKKLCHSTRSTAATRQEHGRLAVEIKLAPKRQAGRGMTGLASVAPSAPHATATSASTFPSPPKEGGNSEPPAGRSATKNAKAATSSQATPTSTCSIGGARAVATANPTAGVARQAVAVSAQKAHTSRRAKLPSEAIASRRNPNLTYSLLFCRVISFKSAGNSHFFSQNFQYVPS